jgi:3-hydroxyisobutyrate dehydrogenase
MASPEPSSTRVGWIGIGVMGSSMLGHLLSGGYAATVYTRTRERAEPLVEQGADWAASPAAVAEASDVVFTMVGFPADVREVVLGPDGVLSAARPGSVVVDMTTSEPSLAVEIFEAGRARDVATLDAPVSGGDVGARNAALSIMVGGDEATVERVRPLLELMGTTIVHQGPAGAGQHTKMVNQTLIATGSWSLTNYAPRMLKGDFAPGFYVEHFLKDMEIALAEARRMNLALPGLALAHELYLALRAQGGGRNGTQSLILALARLSDVDWK